MDLLEKENDKCNFSITNCDVRANTTSGAVPSKILLQISGTESNIKDVAGKVADLVQNHPSAEGSFTMKDMVSIFLLSFSHGFIDSFFSFRVCVCVCPFLVMDTVLLLFFFISTSIFLVCSCSIFSCVIVLCCGRNMSLPL